MKNQHRSPSPFPLTLALMGGAICAQLASCASTPSEPIKTTVPAVTPTAAARAAETDDKKGGPDGNSDVPKFQQESLNPLYAEPITPELVAKAQHLGEFTGQLVLGSQTVQVVLPGVQPEPGRDAYQPLIAAVFVRDGNGWHREASHLTIDLAVTQTKTKRAYYVTSFATDVGVGAASVTLGLSPEDNGTARTEVTVALAHGAASPSVILADFINGRSPFAQLHTWSVRLNLSDEAPISVAAGEAPPLDRFVRAVIAPEDGGTLAIIPFGVATTKETPSGELIVTPEAGMFPGKPGFELGVGSASAAALPHRLAAVDECARTGQKDRTAWIRNGGARLFHAALSQCLQAVPFAQIILKAPMDADAALAKLPRSVQVRTAGGQTLTQTLVFPGQALTIAIPPHVVHTVSTLDSDGDPQVIQPLDPGASANIAVAARVFQPVTIAAKGDDEPAFTAVYQFTNTGNVPILKQLTAQWPLRVPLSKARYELVVFRGGIGPLCDLAVTSDTSGPFNCALRAFEPGAAKDVWRVDLATASPTLEQAALRSLTGAAITAHPVAKADSWRVGDDEVAVIEANESGHWEQLRLFPVDKRLATVWQQYDDGRQNRLARMVEFRRRFARHSILELACPPAWVPADEFRRRLLKHRVDAAQVVGCGSARRERELLTALTRAIHKGRPAVQPTAASALVSAPIRGYDTPALLVPRSNGQSFSGELLAPQLTAGLVSVCNGATLQWIPARTEKPEAAGAFTGEVRLTALASVAVKRLVVTSDKGIVWEQKLVPTDATLALNVKLRANSDWFRIELYGVSKPAVTEQLVATTGFIRTNPSFDADDGP